MLVLALLANTNVHSAILAYVAMGIWIWDTVAEPRDAPLRSRIVSVAWPILIGSSGLLAAAALTMPNRNTIVTNVYNLGLRDLAALSVAALKHPGKSFDEVIPGGVALPGWVSDVLVYTLLLGLVRHPQLLAAGLIGHIALGTFFRAVYPGFLRHQGLFLVFLLSLYWIGIQCYRPSHSGIRQAISKLALYFALVMVLLAGVSRAGSAVLEDLWLAKSSSQAFGRFLRDKSDPVSLDTVWTTMTAAKEAGHARQAAEGHSSW
jgi:hypothetical protein